MRSGPAFLALAIVILLSACGARPGKPVEDLTGKHDVTAFALQSLQGTRDGERLEVRALFGDGSQPLTTHLRFNVTPPAKLVSGSWTGLGSEGEIRQRSVTFLGGQSGPPSIGGRFELIGPGNVPLYRITIPLQELTKPL